MAAVFVGLGTAYCFRWGPVIRHVPSSWISSGDLADTFAAAVAFSHGHLGTVYNSNSSFISYPGILIALLPLAALNGTFHTTFVAIFQHGHLVTGVPQIAVSHTHQVLESGTTLSKGTEYTVQPQWFAFVAPYVMALSCVALFACDRLAEQLGVGRARRIMLGIIEAVVLWPVVVMWGHPEDALALGLAVYAVSLALDERFVGAGWLLGAAIACQPFALVLFPILLFLGGTKQLLGLLVRGLAPAAVLVAGPVIADFHNATVSLVKQPTFPLYANNHVTPWTFLAPRVRGSGANIVVAGGPTRLVVLPLVVAAGWLARRWRSNAAVLVLLVALAFGLRVYFESVLTSYYVWPALAVGLIVAALRSLPRFSLAAVSALATTVVSQWQIAWALWWCLDIAGITVLLAVVAWPPPPVVSSAAVLGPADARPHAQRRPPPVPRGTGARRAPSPAARRASRR